MEEGEAVDDTERRVARALEFRGPRARLRATPRQQSEAGPFDLIGDIHGCLDTPGHCSRGSDTRAWTDGPTVTPKGAGPCSRATASTGEQQRGRTASSATAPRPRHGTPSSRMTPTVAAAPCTTVHRVRTTGRPARGGFTPPESSPRSDPPAAPTRFRVLDIAPRAQVTQEPTPQTAHGRFTPRRIPTRGSVRRRCVWFGRLP